MCVVERRTYVHSDGRRDVVERARTCHHASGNRLCRYIDYKDVEIARVIEARPSSSKSSPLGQVVTTDRGGRERTYHPLFRTTSKRESTRRYSNIPPDNERSPVDSVLGHPSPLQPKYREVSPSTPMPPTISTTLPSARRPGLISPTSPPDPTRTVGPDGTAIYSRPPSLEIPRAPINERASLPRRGSSSAAVDEPEPEPPLRAPSNRKRRPSRVVIIDAGSSSPAFEPSSGSPSLPGLSNLPAIQSTRRRDSKGKRPSRDRADPALETPNQPDEAEQEARWEQERLEEAALLHQHRRQRTRPLEAYRDPPDALEGTTTRRPSPSFGRRRETELQRKMEAEKAQMARERAQADARRRASSQPPSSPSPPPSPFPRHPVLSTRKSAPPPPPPPIVHHHNSPSPPSSPPSPRNKTLLLLERGDAVIAAQRARRRAAAAAQRLEDHCMAGLELEDAEEEEAVVDAEDMRRSSSKSKSKSKRGGGKRDGDWRGSEYYY